MAALGNVDGDMTTTQVAVGAETSQAGNVLSGGAIYLLSITPQGEVIAANKISAHVGGFAVRLNAFDYFGSAIASVGDLDGNPLTSALAVGARGDDVGGFRAGAVYILFIARGSRGDVRVDSHAKINGFAAGAEFGTSICAPGDLDRDGIPDIIVGAPSRISTGLLGAVHVIYLSTDGSASSRSEIGPSTWGATGPILLPGALFGAAVASSMCNHSAVIAVGAPGAMNFGAVVLIQLAMATGGRRLQATALRTIAVRVMSAPASLQIADAQFGAALAYAADYDGNGILDLAVGAPGHHARGSVALHYMDSDAFRSFRSVTLSAEEALGPSSLNVTQFGRAIVSLGAMNLGDIVDDLAIGARLDRQPALPGTGLIAFLFFADMSETVAYPPSIPPHDALPPSPEPTLPIAPPPSPSPPMQSDEIATVAAPPSPPGVPSIDVLTGSEALTEDGSGGIFIKAWVVSLIGMLALLGACALYHFGYRQHRPVELVKMSCAGLLELASETRGEGRVTAQCRIEIRGPVSAKRSHRVRASQAGSEQVTPDVLPAAMPNLDPDVMLNVCYAPNVCHAPNAAMLARAPSATTGFICTDSHNPMCTLGGALHEAGERMVDLSKATESLLRGGAVYHPDYVLNAPQRGVAIAFDHARSVAPLLDVGLSSSVAQRSSSRPAPGGLAAVAEEERERTWGQDSQISDGAGTEINTCARCETTRTVSPAAESGAMLRI